jgi:hypothetical protein
MFRLSFMSLVPFLFTVTLTVSSQQQPEDAAANPGRPTIATPAALTPVGYLQFETGVLGADHSPMGRVRRIYLLATVQDLSALVRRSWRNSGWAPRSCGSRLQRAEDVPGFQLQQVP